MQQSRRNFLSRSVTAVSSAAASTLLPFNGVDANDGQAGSRILLGFSTYGAKTLRTETTIDLIAGTGYDSVEITVWPDWDAAPGNMPPDRRSQIRKQLSDSGLVLTSLMEHLSPEADDARHKSSLERLKSVFQLANDLAPDRRPVVQTVLGSGNWDDKKSLFVDRVGEWVTLGKSHGVVTCVKPHRGGGMSKPSEAVWLINQIGDAHWLKMVYDFSHYAFRDIPLVDSIQQSLPHIGHVAVKDAVQTVPKDGQKSRVEFQLPGEAGTIDFVTILQTLHKGGYAGDISCEVSGMVSGKPGYDPVAALKTCYSNLSKAFNNAGIKRS
ncbi:MAG: sugar phosphate isomerase/epimerase [Planctomycetota bacterium]|nr:sugar phosphate isomerase/epimerase [Planctomycetota bacterium]MDA0920247.1 sugar phosphate isomerase/epimerase [Planctomycetota bacterium]